MNEHLEEWAERRSIVRRRTRTARQYHTVEGTGLVQFYPSTSALEVWIETHRKTRPEVAERTYEAIKRFAGGTPATKYPKVPCKAVSETGRRSSATCSSRTWPA